MINVTFIGLYQKYMSNVTFIGLYQKYMSNVTFIKFILNVTRIQLICH